VPENGRSDEDEQWLSGNVGGALRVGATVRRPTGPWTPAVHALLGHLAARGLPHIPRVLGFDDTGREMLTYLPGRVVDNDTEHLSDRQLTALVAWTRDLHRAVADFRHAGPWRYPVIPDATLIGHNDIAPYNACFAAGAGEAHETAAGGVNDGALAGVFDWDMSGPTNPLMELGFIAWNCVPMWRDIGPAAAAHRLTLMTRAYGGPYTARDILRAVRPRVEILLDAIPLLAAAGDTGMANLMALGEPGNSRRSLAGVIARTPAIDAALRG
jgi:hypothetical protein